MNSLRFLLVHRNPKQSEEIASRLAVAHHTVLPTSGLEEAADALTMERFDAILMESAFRASGLSASGRQNYGVEEFTSELRRMEQSQQLGTRVPVIALTDGITENLDGWADAVVPEPLDTNALTAAVGKLASALSGRMSLNARLRAGSLPIFNPEKFREQVGFDNELMLEIIDLFLEERQRQEFQMSTAFEIGDFDALSRLAHTIKGSLGSLHAQRARSRAEDLEAVAKLRDQDTCGQCLAVLLQDLADLEPQLIALKHVSA